MADLVPEPELSEAEFAKLVDRLAADPTRRGELTDLLREEHPYYNERSASAVVRMRGWLLLAVARVGLSDSELPFVLEEFNVGTDAYLVAAAARALRSYARPSALFAPFVIQALTNIRDEPLSFDNYGEYATSSTTTPIVELLAVLTWLGPHARACEHELVSMRAQPGRFSKKLLRELDRTIAAIGQRSVQDESQPEVCCLTVNKLGQRWGALQERETTETVHSIVFEDQDGAPVRFREFFSESPSIVVFFYTRCDNPWKCSLTVTKLARVQQLLRERGMALKIKTAAITYDAAFDLPKRLREYGQNRGLHFDAHHRMLRTKEGFTALRDHLNLGVNFMESLVNRHRIELYILDSEGRVAACFERIRWDELQVVDRAIEVLKESAVPRAGQPSVNKVEAATTVFGALASLAFVFFPKCPICWAAYLSAFGIAGTRYLPYPTKMQPVLLAVMLINVISVWFRARATHCMGGFYLVCGGMFAIAFAVAFGLKNLATWGVVSTFAGSLWNAVNRRHLKSSLELIRGNARVDVPE